MRDNLRFAAATAGLILFGAACVVTAFALGLLA